jgi:hypothetical protein
VFELEAELELEELSRSESAGGGLDSGAEGAVDGKLE